MGIRSEGHHYRSYIKENACHYYMCSAARLTPMQLVVHACLDSFALPALYVTYSQHNSGCGVVVNSPGYEPRAPGFDSRLESWECIMADIFTPMSEAPMLNSPGNDKAFQECKGEEKVRMKKQLGLLEGVAIILGIIFGSGIFVSPKGVIMEVESVGLSLMIWVISGLLSMIGALCYAELGTSIPKSGGGYAYIFEAFGPLPAFLYLWDAMLIFVPTTSAIMGLTFANYVIQPFFPNCSSPDSAVRLIAAVTICFMTFMNCYNIKQTRNTSNFENAFEGGSTDPGKIAVAIYSGLFSYSGWNCLNYVTEELRNSYVNLPRAIYISLPLVTLIYVFANVAYLAVLTPIAMKASNAIAVLIAGVHLMSMVDLLTFLVSRMCFVGARYGHFPAMLSHINVKRFTPTPSLVFLNILSLAMLCTSDVYVLITYSSFVESFFIMLSVCGMLWLRYKRPNMNRPIKVSLWVPIVFIVVCMFLVFVPCYYVPYEVGMGVLITVTGIPAFFLGVSLFPRKG
uniref:Amino acid permease/ SLC12A domain-containing protein n=1 Tax=Timema monikensis TaxID=170555 RepID=A0A7R9E149_9NEOP|nr:unnamed protein product [Timema monikensis]